MFLSIGLAFSFLFLFSASLPFCGGRDGGLCLWDVSLRLCCSCVRLLVSNSAVQSPVYTVRFADCERLEGRREGGAGVKAPPIYKLFIYDSLILLWCKCCTFRMSCLYTVPTLFGWGASFRMRFLCIKGKQASLILKIKSKTFPLVKSLPFINILLVLNKLKFLLLLGYI